MLLSLSRLCQQHQTRPPSTIVTPPTPHPHSTPPPPPPPLPAHLIQKMKPRLIACQLSIVSPQEKAKFRRANVGLIRKGNKVYIITIFPISQSTLKRNTFLVNENTIEILPASIKLKEFDKFLFIRNPDDDQRYSTMIREIKVILRESNLRKNGKSDIVDQLILTIPTLNELSPLDLSGPQPQIAIINNQPIGLGGDDFKALATTSDFATCCTPSLENQDDSQNKCPVSMASNNSSINNNKRRYPQLENSQLKCIRISGLEGLPKSLWCRATLRELTLSDCKLTFIPKQLEKFATSLVQLDLSNNKIDKLPRSFCCRMSKLEYLNLNSNQLETLPIEIRFLYNMVTLDLSHNKLRMLPTTFSDLRKLRMLNVAHNNLSQLPAFKSEDVRLYSLDVSDNPLDGGSSVSNTYEVYPSINDGWNVNYMENLFSKQDQQQSPTSKNNSKQIPKLFEISLLNIVRNNRLFKLASEENLPRTIVSTMQRDIFKCYKCSKMSILPAYNTTDILDYLSQVDYLTATGSFRYRMTFMKLLCRGCFDIMSS